MRTLIRFVVFSAVVAGIYFLWSGTQTSFGRIGAQPVIVHLANCTPTALSASAGDSAAFAIPAGESRDVDNLFWGAGHVTRGRRFDYSVPRLPAEVTHGGTATLFLQIDDQSRLQLASGAGCSAPRISPQPAGFPVEPR